MDYGEGYGADDVIGSYCNLRTGEIEWFKNGISLGVAYKIPHEIVNAGFYRLYPTVCLRESGVQVNFGRSGWICPPRYTTQRVWE